MPERVLRVMMGDRRYVLKLGTPTKPLQLYEVLKANKWRRVDPASKEAVAVARRLMEDFQPLAKTAKRETRWQKLGKAIGRLRGGTSGSSSRTKAKSES